MRKHRRGIDQLFFLQLFIIGVPCYIVTDKIVAEITSDFPYVQSVFLGISCIYLSLYLSLDLLIPRIIILISKVVSNVVIIKVATFIIRMIVGLSKGLLRPRQSKAARFTMMKLGEVRLS
jgi:hypothetical protein